MSMVQCTLASTDVIMDGGMSRPTELTDYIHPSLANLDFSLARTNCYIIAAAFAAFSAIYICSAIIAHQTWTYNNLRMKEKIFWNLSVVRGVFGIFGTVIGIWTIWFDTELVKDVVFAKTSTSFFALDVTIGFFCLECTALLVTDFVYRQQNLLLNIHHWLALAGYLMVLYYGSSHYFGTVGLMLEMSTPFTALCWTLLKCGQAKTWLWQANQAILVHLFHCRTILEGYLWLQTIRNWSHIWSSMPLPIFASLYTQLTLIFFVMTPYWTYKKTAQMHTPIDWNFEDYEKSKETNGCVKKD